jgi:hypothetical protein
MEVWFMGRRGRLDPDKEGACIRGRYCGLVSIIMLHVYERIAIQAERHAHGIALPSAGV